ncbi:bifunctional 3,4-dihydroxy-2-butanone-4-phosphate synthase/GTP cyclohydrolase II [Amphibacillus xylanus]|uniref:GTP cyclohydrolase-2 n=2 Tax=Amphibacillus xylanus TaxID=1449 RepID=K0IX34_AMPXN|nr:bifunctional 3,4-dihydroxy-2-butanone-4-phosphate synthase/GTP cyclohydrolase II [Amphibacillus xylanus]BAG54995.1 riboflavin biosynthesis protein ribA [Amphibacillus xylanus]BAM47005.1 3,4-dihydroxy-2-butanone 4-phosphate synthase/GTP cyclohydrolase II [Amphibacillus xylanus NBRC 15112]
MTKHIEKAIEDLKQGKLIIVVDDDNREAEGDLVGLASLATAETVNFMTKHARGLICAPISEAIADHFGLTEMIEENTDPYRTAFTISVDHKETSTGISAFDRAKTIKELANLSNNEQAFHKPGHIFPLIAKEGGVLERRGHTEAAIDLAKLANEPQATYICEILNDDGTMARRPQLEALAAEWKMPIISIEELVTYLTANQELTVKLPTSYGDFDLTLFEDQANKEHLLLSKGEIRSLQEPLLIRVHSECLTGDIFGSHRCDCGEQLHEALRMIEENGIGAILYLRQEGRGIGLKNKLKTYQLQENGLDTFDANIALGFEPDERDYHFAAQILKSLGIKMVNLITNNPDKIEQLQAFGIEVVERIPLEVRPEKENLNYLRTKKEKFDHLLSIN